MIHVFAGPQTDRATDVRERGPLETRISVLRIQIPERRMHNAYHVRRQTLIGSGVYTRDKPAF